MMDHPLRRECCAHGQACMCDKGKIPAEYPFSFLAYLLIHIKEAGILQRPQWLLMVHHSILTKNSIQTRPVQPVQTVKHLTLFSLLNVLAYWAKQEEAERLKSRDTNECTGLDHLKEWVQPACCSPESPIKPLAPIHLTLVFTLTFFFSVPLHLHQMSARKLGQCFDGSLSNPFCTTRII